MNMLKNLLPCRHIQDVRTPSRKPLICCINNDMARTDVCLASKLNMDDFCFTLLYFDFDQTRTKKDTLKKKDD